MLIFVCTNTWSRSEFEIGTRRLHFQLERDHFCPCSWFLWSCKKLARIRKKWNVACLWETVHFSSAEIRNFSRERSTVSSRGPSSGSSLQRKFSLFSHSQVLKQEIQRRIPHPGVRRRWKERKTLFHLSCSVFFQWLSIKLETYRYLSSLWRPNSSGNISRFSLAMGFFQKFGFFLNPRILLLEVNTFIPGPGGYLSN